MKNPFIELYRGIAALMVMMCHYAHILYGGERGWMNFLYTGVDFFFVISGFVFAPHILGVFQNKSSIYQFFTRRFFRIYPLYLLSVIFYFWFSPNVPQKMEYLINHLGMLHTIHSREEAGFFNLAYWSLPVELEFYIAVPLLSFLMYKLKSYFSVTTIIFSWIIIAFSIHCSVALSENVAYKMLGVHLPGMLIEFLIGTMAFHASRLQRSIKKSILSLLSGLIVLFLLGDFFVRYGDDGISNSVFLKTSFGVLCAISYACILYATVHISVPDHLRTKFESLCQFSGRMSYGLYLFHNLAPMIFIYLAAFVVVPAIYQYVINFAFTLLLVFIFNKWYEEPLNIYGKLLAGKIGGSGK